MIIEKNIMYKIIFRSEKIINKDFSKIPKSILDNVLLKIECLSKNWINNAQVKKLNNYNLCDYRLRVWDYRILFNLNYDTKELILFRVLHRSKLY